MTMAYNYELASIICQTFEKDVGRWQAKKPDGGRRAMLVSFSARIDHDKEEGYRQIDLLIYGPMNYVQVWTRKRATVIALEDLEDGDDGGIKPGKDYTTSATEWELLCDHDSGWRTDGVQDFLRKNERDINGFDSPGDWYTSVPIPAEMLR